MDKKSQKRSCGTNAQQQQTAQSTPFRPAFAYSLHFTPLARSAKAEIQVLNYAKAISGLNLTHDEFVDLCILLGCDYCDSIKGIGPVSALKLIREHKNIETILKNLNRDKYDIPANWLRGEKKKGTTTAATATTTTTTTTSTTSSSSAAAPLATPSGTADEDSKPAAKSAENTPETANAPAPAPAAEEKVEPKDDEEVSARGSRGGEGGAVGSKAKSDEITPVWYAYDMRRAFRRHAECFSSSKGQTADKQPV